MLIFLKNLIDLIFQNLIDLIVQYFSFQFLTFCQSCRVYFLCARNYSCVQCNFQRKLIPDRKSFGTSSSIKKVNTGISDRLGRKQNRWDFSWKKRDESTSPTTFRHVQMSLFWDFCGNWDQFWRNFECAYFANFIPKPRCLSIGFKNWRSDFCRKVIIKKTGTIVSQIKRRNFSSLRKSEFQERKKEMDSNDELVGHTWHRFGEIWTFFLHDYDPNSPESTYAQICDFQSFWERKMEQGDSVVCFDRRVLTISCWWK